MILIMEVKYVKVNCKEYWVFWFSKTFVFLVLWSAVVQQDTLSSSPEAQLIYLIIRLYYFPGWNNINLLLVCMDTQYCFILDFMWILGHGPTSWSTQSTIKASVTCLVGQLKCMREKLWSPTKCKPNCKKLTCLLRGQEGIGIMDKNKWQNGLFGEKYSLGAIRPLNLVEFTAPRVMLQSLRFFLYAYAVSLDEL